MTLPTDFKSVIEEEYGEFGWELSNCFSLIAEILGYKVYDLSSVETALKIASNEAGQSLKNCRNPKSLFPYLQTNYLKVHNVLIRKAKTVALENEDKEFERAYQVSQKFVARILGSTYSIKGFYKVYVIDQVQNSVDDFIYTLEGKLNTSEDSEGSEGSEDNEDNDKDNDKDN